MPGDQIAYLFEIGPLEKILVFQLKCGSCTHISVQSINLSLDVVGMDSQAHIIRFRVYTSCMKSVYLWKISLDHMLSNINHALYHVPSNIAIPELSEATYLKTETVNIIGQIISHDDVDIYTSSHVLVVDHVFLQMNFTPCINQATSLQSMYPCRQSLCFASFLA